MGNPLWDFSLATYSLDGVAPTCLDLQDRFGLDVNLLLYAAWIAHRGRRLTHHHLVGMEAAVGDWRHNVVMPARALRRRWQGYPPAAAILDEIKALELRAEQQQQDMIYGFHQQAAELPLVSPALHDNLAQIAQFYSPGDTGWLPVLARLEALLSR